MNPELQRQLWLRMSPFRLVSTVVIFTSIVVIALANDKGAELNANLALAGLFAGALMGIRAARDSIAEEIQQRTWDFQRLSTLSASEMAFGKLLGSTSFAWFVTALSSIVFLYFSAHVNKLSVLFTALLLTSLCHCLSALFSTATAQENREGRSFPLQSIAGIAAIIVISFSISVTTAKKLQYSGVNWHGYRIDGSFDFSIVSLLLFNAWALLGVYFTMRRALLFRNPLWPWIGFLMFLTFYLGGFSPITDVSLENHLLRITLAGVFSSYIFVYLSSFGDSKSLVTLKRLLKSFEDKDYQLASHLFPRWIIAFCFAATCLLASLFLPISSAFSEVLIRERLFGLMLFAVRDIGLIYYLNFRPAKPNRKLWGGLFYFAILYLILPLLVTLISKDYLHIFYPFYAKSWSAAIIPGLVQIMAVGYFLLRAIVPQLALGKSDNSSSIKTLFLYCAQYTPNDIKTGVCRLPWALGV